MPDLSDVERMVDDFERNAAERAAKYQRMQEQVEQISITESAASGAVSVTVGSNGIPTDVRMTDAVSGMRPEEIAAAVVQAMRKAQAKYPERLAEITAATVGQDATTEHILATAAEQFPPAPEEDEEPPAPTDSEMQLYDRPEDEEPQPPQPPAGGTRPPRRSSDDDDGDEPFDEGSVFDR